MASWENLFYYYTSLSFQFYLICQALIYRLLYYCDSPISLILELYYCCYLIFHIFIFYHVNLSNLNSLFFLNFYALHEIIKNCSKFIPFIKACLWLRKRKYFFFFRIKSNNFKNKSILIDVLISSKLRNAFIYKDG